mmetsp:Transcript_9900/g.20130  ORF Transcript_9900/g.20130 Transcript_9900/m.20130 type:complete len:381 (-) Transcript_9900:489-1631(-)
MVKARRTVTVVDEPSRGGAANPFAGVELGARPVAGEERNETGDRILRKCPGEPVEGLGEGTEQVNDADKGATNDTQERIAKTKEEEEAKNAEEKVSDFQVPTVTGSNPATAHVVPDTTIGVEDKKNDETVGQEGKFGFLTSPIESSAAKSAAQSDDTESATNPKPLFSFGSTAASEFRPVFNFGAAVATDSKPAFSFSNLASAGLASGGDSAFGGFLGNVSSAEAADVPGADEPFEPIDPHGKPVTPLLPQVEVKTGEESENERFRTKAKLYGLDGGSWRERGVGQCKINVERKDPRRARVVMRTDGSHRLILNFRIGPSVVVEPASEKSARFTVPDLESRKATSFLLKMVNKEELTRFMTEFGQLKTDIDSEASAGKKE